MSKRPLLAVSAGAVVVTVLEGIACGNPVAPHHPPQPIYQPDASVDAPTDSAPVPVDAGIDAEAQ